VTGSSRGLGSAIARRLARDGFAVAVNDRHGGEQALAVVGAIREWGGVAETFPADITDAASRSMLRNHEKFPSVSRYTGPGGNADGWVEIYLEPGIDGGLAVGYLTRHTTL
jgi:3-oxoacyl-[acyl-carrier protein] reductase